MPPPDFYQRLPEFLILVFLLVALFSAEMLGWRIGHGSRGDADEAARSQVSALQAAVLGLLALLLGFTFSMAADRFDERRALVVEEANAIGTALLRTSLVEQPRSGALKVLLEQYIDVRVEYYRAGADVSKVKATLAEGDRIQAELWRLAVDAARAAPTPTTALLVSGLNHVIDMNASRLAALSNHVPSVVMWMLLFVAVLSAGITGYAAGFASKHYVLPAAVVLLLIAAVSLTIVDLDRPRRGLIHNGQAAMLELQESVKHTPAATHEH